MGTSDDSGLFKTALSADQTVKLAHLAEQYGREGKRKKRHLCVEDIQINCCSRTQRGRSQSTLALEHSLFIRPQWLVMVESCLHKKIITKDLVSKKDLVSRYLFFFFFFFC